MTERDPADREAEQAGAEAGAIGGRAPADEDPERRPVEEAGGGESEGFEQAEEQLRENAEQGHGSPSAAREAFKPEAESDRETAERAED